jgi:TM2 domain-containing membrane protein YozV
MGFRFNQGDRPLPGYTIQRGVGRGGFGEVYYATSDGGKEVALKWLRENPQVELRGVTHCLNLKSPHLVALHDVKQSPDGDFFVIMEFVSGPSLRDLLNAEPAGLGPQKAAYFLREIARGLAYLHDRGIVHRDLKPGNIFYEDGYVKIGDYGLAKIMAASQHSGQTMSVGTVHYMAPEIGSGNYDRTIDIYALGVILYEMLLGRVPFAGATMGEVLMKHLTAQPAVDELPAPFPSVLRKALAKDPRDRYQTVQEMMAEVFAVRDMSQAVDAIDSLTLTRMAAAVARRVKTTPQEGGGIATGSSNATAWATPPPIPPPVVAPASRRPAGAGRTAQRGILGQVEDMAFGIQNAATFPQRTRLATGLLGVCLGWLGIHRFYTGYNRIGVIQIVASFATGIGCLWGIIEGLQILLNGDYRDALGRPLLDRSSAAVPGARSGLIRTLWGIATFIPAGGALATFCVATFAQPEMAPCGVSTGGESFYWNEMHGLYFVSCGLAGLALFTLWKASHRGGLGAWRATVRPAFLCLMAALIGAGLNFAVNVAAGEIQLAGMLAAAVAASAFTFAWILRGPDSPLLPGDAYWARAWANIHLGIFMLASLSGSLGLAGWSRDDFRLSTGAEKFRTTIAQAPHWAAYAEPGDAFAGIAGEIGVHSPEDSEPDDSEAAGPGTRARQARGDARRPAQSRRAAAELRQKVLQIRRERGDAAPREYRVAQLQYSLSPLLVLFSGLAAVGSLNESFCRRRQVRRALAAVVKPIE